MAGALDGLRVLDLTRVMAGPTATQLLGDFGAEIIKVEKPGLGDDTRAWGPPFVEGRNGPTQESTYYLSANRNKRSIAIDLKSKDGANTVKELLQHCDVLIENFKPGTLQKFGLAYSDLKDQFPQLVYCSITGYGQYGPNSAKPGYDLLAQAFSGIMSITGTPDGDPMKVGVAVADIVTGLYASNAILAALRHRDKSGEGQSIDLSLADCTVSWLINEGTKCLATGETPVRWGNEHASIVPYQVFEVRDGYVAVAVGNDRQFERFCNAIGRPDLSQQEEFKSNSARLKNRDLLIQEISKALIKEYKYEIIDKCEMADVPIGPINSIAEALDSEQISARDMRVTMPYESALNGKVELLGNPVKFSRTPVEYRLSPPKCGQDQDYVLEKYVRSRE